MQGSALAYCDALNFASRLRRAARRGYDLYKARRASVAARARGPQTSRPGAGYGAAGERTLQDDLALLMGALASSRHSRPTFRALWRPILSGLLQVDTREGLATLKVFARALEREYRARAPRPERWDPEHRRAQIFASELDAIMAGWAGVWRALAYEREGELETPAP